MREVDGYRDTLADIVEVTGKHLLNTADVAKYTGLCYQTAKKRFGKEIPATVLARMLVKGSAS